jgi:phage shock protein C
MGIPEELERLQALRNSGALSETEYAQAKARILGEAAAGTGATGSNAGMDTGATGSFLHRLHRSTTDRVIGGVCGGLGAHTGLPSWAWRVIFCLTLLYFGVGLVLYLLLWIFVPPAPTPPGGAS